MSPLTKTGLLIRKKFYKEYGPKRGKRIFYSWEHKNPWVLKHRKKGR